MNAPHNPSFRRLLTLTDRLAASVEFLRFFETATATERDELSRGWPFDVSWPYPSPWRLSCRQGERWSPEDRILTTLVLAGLNHPRDAREAQILFCVVYNSCLLASLSPEELFKRAAALLPKKAATDLLSFLSRDPEDRSLDSFLLEAVTNEFGERELRPTWQGAS